MTSGRPADPPAGQNHTRAFPVWSGVWAWDFQVIGVDNGLLIVGFMHPVTGQILDHQLVRVVPAARQIRYALEKPRTWKLRGIPASTRLGTPGISATSTERNTSN